MLAEPQPTSYDVVFRVWGFPARVHPLFWATTVLLGRPLVAEDEWAVKMALWVGLVFVSILVHELGHALAFRAYGAADARVWLYWFGGLAVAGGASLTPWRSIAVAVAGPAAGFVLFFAVWGSELAVGWSRTNDLTGLVYLNLWHVNLVWGLVNLLPVWPLDGGRVCREASALAGARRPDVASLKISVGVAAAMAAYSLVCAIQPPPPFLAAVPYWARGSLYTALLFGLLAYTSYDALQRAGRRSGLWDDPDDDTPPWRR